MIATEADLSLIIELGREAHTGSVWDGLAEFDPESFAASARHLMQSADAEVFVCDRGTFWVARFPLFFNHAEAVASEVFYYATRNGDALRREAEVWVGSGLMTICRHEKTDPRLDTLYRRAGYQPIERTFIRRA